MPHENSNNFQMMTVEENHYEELNPEINISDEINHSDSNKDDNSIDEKTEMEHSYVEDNFDNRYLHKDSNLKLIEVCHSFWLSKIDLNWTIHALKRCWY